MKVRIDSGPIVAQAKLESVPQDQWYALMGKREWFVKAHMAHDCRCLLQFVEDAERMFSPLGFKDADDFIANGLKLEPIEIRLAVEWLKINKPNEPVPYAVVQKLAAHGEYGKSRPKDRGSNTTSIGRGAEYIAARLERDGHTELAAKVRSKEVPALTAAIEVGYRKVVSPRDRIARLIVKHLPKLSTEDRAELHRLLDALEPAPTS